MELELKQYSENLEATVRERTETLRSAKNQLEHVIELNPAVIFTVKLLPDLRMEVTYMSKNIVSLSGFEAKEFVGRKGEDFWEKRIHPDDLSLYRSELPKLLNPNQNNWFSEYRFLCGDGVYRWIREELNVIRDSTGKIGDLIGLWTDVTDRKESETLEEKRKAELAKKLNDITDRLESLTKIREKLKTAPDITTGLDSVLENILWSFGLDCGAVLVFDRKTNTVNVRASKARTKELRLNQSYPIDVVELKDLQAKSITRTPGEDERSILGTEVVHAIPIRAATEIYGALVLGNEKQNSLEEEDKRILELYAELVYSFMIEKSMSLTPVLESTKEHVSGLVSKIELGEMYLFKKNPTDAFEVFTNTVFAGHEGLCITRMYPPKIRSKYDLQKTPILWLTNEAAEGEQCVYSIQDLSIAVGDFLERAQKAVVLIDGFEYLITNHGFDSFLTFLQILKNRMQRRNGILLASIFEQALAPRELALIEREMQPFGR